MFSDTDPHFKAQPYNAHEGYRRQFKLIRQIAISHENRLELPRTSPKDTKVLTPLQNNRRKADLKRTVATDKTLWDWLQLLGILAVPVVLALAFVLFNIHEDALNQQQLHLDLQIANDQQQEATLKTYLNDMSDLLLNHNLRESNSDDEVRKVAREWTLTTLHRLGANRNRIVLQFLQDAHLIGVNYTVIDLSNADLSNVNLSGANLSGVHLDNANLSGANLSGANLSSVHLSGVHLSNVHLVGIDLIGADLHGADLSGADLHGANLKGADLHAANLKGADLHAADLRNADLSSVDLYAARLYTAHLSGADLDAADLRNADLSRANLSGVTLDKANLSGAVITNQQLAVTKSLKGTLMPDGSTSS